VEPNSIIFELHKHMKVRELMIYPPSKAEVSLGSG
jgi:hypothetical protein